MGIFILRILVVASIAAAGYFFPPFQMAPQFGALTGFVLGVIIVYLETRIRKSQFKIIWGSTLG
ncbi:MAG: PIN domain nuclease, partial [Candidatus Aminicenantaceae bacterium]